MEICNRCVLEDRPECKPEYLTQCKATEECEHFYEPSAPVYLFIRGNPEISLCTLRKIYELKMRSVGFLEYEYLQTRLDKYLKENPDAIPPGYPEEI